MRKFSLYSWSGFEGIARRPFAGTFPFCIFCACQRRPVGKCGALSAILGDEAADAVEDPSPTAPLVSVPPTHTPLARGVGATPQQVGFKGQKRTEGRDTVPSHAPSPSFVSISLGEQTYQERKVFYGTK